MRQPVLPFSQIAKHYDMGFGGNAILMIVFFSGVILLAISSQLMMGGGEIFTAETILIMVAGMGGILVFNLLIMGVVRAVYKNQERRTIAKLTDPQKVWAVWQYDPQEWTELAERQFNYERNLYKSWYSYIGVVIVVAMFGYMTLATPVPTNVRWIYVQTGGFVVAMILGSGFWYSRSYQKKVRITAERRLQHPTPLVYISPNGVFHETEGYLAFDKLRSIELNLSGDLPQLIMTARIKAGKYRYTYPFSIPIPRGAVADAKQLVAFYQHHNTKRY